MAHCVLHCYYERAGFNSVVILAGGMTALKRGKGAHTSSKQQPVSFIAISHAGTANQRRAGG